MLGGVRDVARIHYPTCTDSIKPSLQFSCNFVVINASEGSLCSRFLYFTTAGVKCCVAAVKSCLVLHFSIVIFFWPFGIIDASTIKCWELSTAQVGAKGVRDVARIHYPTFTDTIKPSLQFSCNFVVINASEGSLFFKIFILHNSRCQVLCGSCKKLPCTSPQCCYIFLALRDHWCQHY
jgi:hypothetical protein